MQLIRSCGFLIFRNQPGRQFLLMRHRDRWDLPKGHVDPGESDLQCALRELQEETGLEPNDVAVDPEFKFVTEYPVRFPQGQDRVTVRKQLVVFLGIIEGPGKIILSEHIGFEWWDWNPPMRIQTQTIDALLEQVKRHFESAAGRS